MALHSNIRLNSFRSRPSAPISFLDEISEKFVTEKTDAHVVPDRHNTCFLASVLNLLSLHQAWGETISDLLAQVPKRDPRDKEDAVAQSRVAMIRALDQLLLSTTPARVRVFYLRLYHLLALTGRVIDFPIGGCSDPAELLMFLISQLSVLFGQFLLGVFDVESIVINLSGGIRASYLNAGYLFAIAAECVRTNTRKPLALREQWHAVCELSARRAGTIFHLPSAPVLGDDLPGRFPNTKMLCAISTRTGPDCSKKRAAERHYVLIVFLPDGRIYHIDHGRCVPIQEVASDPQLLAVLVVTIDYLPELLQEILGIPSQ